MKKSEEILKSLNLDEKICLLNGVGSWNTFDAGGKIPVLSMSDGPHGLRHQTGEESYANINDSRRATCFPTASAAASSWNVDALRSMGSAIAKEALAEKVHIMLGCGMNIKRSPLCGRNFEYFSEDPYLTGELAAAYVDGMQKEGVGACIKHFALNNQERYRQSSSSNVDERTMREIYLAGFERAVRKAAPASIMCSYNKINGTYASANRKLLTDILRKEWGFDGIVISDWGADIDAAASLKAGLDLAMPDSGGYIGRQIKKSYEEGQLTEAEIDEACLRIIEVALKLCGDSKAESKADGTEANYTVDFAIQHKTAFELACESAVLLKNDGFYPIVPSATEKKKLLVVGQLAEKMHFQGGGSSHINTAEYPSALECLKNDFDVIYIQGYYSSFSKKKNKENKRLLREAVSRLQEVLGQSPDIPVLYFCGLEEAYEGEGFDRADLQIPESHVTLYKEIINKTKNVGLVTFGGSPFDLTFAGQARALLHMYLCGEASGEACFELLTGRKNPSGKLAETWPLTMDCGAPVDALDVNYTEGTLVGYRWYETKKVPVQYEFGYGLSYTTFEYSELQLEKCGSGDGSVGALYKVSITLENTGKTDGYDTVQLYVRNKEEELPSSAKITRSKIELGAFQKVFLQAGEKKRITLELEARAFSVWSSKNKAFCLVGGEYEICAAASVKDIRLIAPLSLEGASLSELCPPDEEEQSGFFTNRELRKKGEFTITDSLGLMAKESAFVRGLLGIISFILVMSSESKSRDDPAVKISLAALRENPLESLISTSGGAISEHFAQLIVKKANS